MSDGWSPDEPLDTESNESWDEALDEEDDLSPGSRGNPEGERSLDRQLVLDSKEIDQLGAGLDDPERLAVLDGGVDDPDDLDLPTDAERPDQDGWDLDAGSQLEE